MASNLEKAREQLDLGYVETALDLFEKAAETAGDDRERGEALLEIGKLRLLFDEAKQAEEMCRRAVELLPEDAAAHYWLGMARRKQKQWQQALEAFETADRLHPDDPVVLANWGKALCQLGKRQQGRELIERALRLDLGRVDTLLDLVYIYIADDNLDSAHACALRAHELTYGGEGAEEALDMIRQLQEQFQYTGTPKPAGMPRTRREWQQRVGTASDPLALLQELAASDSFQSERALERLANRVMKEWNRAPRPELGGLSPNQVGSRRDRKQSVFDDAGRFPWLHLDRDQAEANTMRRDMVAFLTHIRDTRYTATAKLGNLTLKAVHAINELLTEPVQLESRIGDYVQKARSVSEVWSIYRLQGLAFVGKLARFEPGRRITLLEAGERFLQAAPTRQLWTIFDAWWWHTNWLVAYHLQVFDDFAETQLQSIALVLLRSMPVGRRIQVKDFVDAMIEMGHLDQLTVIYDTALRIGLRHMTVDVLGDFGVLKVKKREEDLGGYRVKEAVSFRVTPLGRALLRAVGDWPSRWSSVGA